MTNAKYFFAAVLLVGSIACIQEDTLEVYAVQPIGPDGGSITSTDGLLSLRFPAGSLEQTVKISVKTQHDASSPYLVSAVYEFGPDGLQFNAPAEVSLAVGVTSTPDILVFANADGAFPIVAKGSSYDSETGELRARLDHFSSYGAFELTCTADADCQLGAVCLSGECRWACAVDSDCPEGISCGEDGICSPSDAAYSCEIEDVALGRTCRTPCSGDADCGEGELCGRHGLCGNAANGGCGDGSICPSGAVCVASECFAVCGTHGDCSGIGQLCEDGICVPSVP